MENGDLRKIFSSARKVVPTKELGQRILANFKVTKEQENRYLLLKDKGRFSFLELILNQIHNLMTNWKTVIPVAIVVLVLVGLAVFQFTQRPSLKKGVGTIETEQPLVMVPKEVSVPEADGSIDTAIAAMIALAENEQTICLEELNDALLLNLDTQAIDDFGQSYDQITF